MESSELGQYADGFVAWSAGSGTRRGPARHRSLCCGTWDAGSRTKSAIVRAEQRGRRRVRRRPPRAGAAAIGTSAPAGAELPAGNSAPSRPPRLSCRASQWTCCWRGSGDGCPARTRPGPGHGIRYLRQARRSPTRAPGSSAVPRAAARVPGLAASGAAGLRPGPRRSGRTPCGRCCASPGWKA